MSYKKLNLIQTDLTLVLKLIYIQSGMMEDDTKCYHRKARQKVNFPITEEKELYQDLDQLLKRFLESCLASESSEAEAYEVLTELAANENVPLDQVRHKISALPLMFRELVEIIVDCKRLSQLSTHSRRKQKKIIKRQLTLIADCNELISKIVSNYWNYLSDDIQEVFRQLGEDSLEIDAETRIHSMKAELNHYGTLSNIKKLSYRFYKSILCLRVSILSKSTEDMEDDDDYCDSSVMKQFLDFLVDDALSNPSKLVPYTEEMSARARYLIAGVHIDDD